MICRTCIANEDYTEIEPYILRKYEGFNGKFEEYNFLRFSDYEKKCFYYFLKKLAEVLIKFNLHTLYNNLINAIKDEKEFILAKVEERTIELGFQSDYVSFRAKIRYYKDYFECTIQVHVGDPYFKMESYEYGTVVEFI